MKSNFNYNKNLKNNARKLRNESTKAEIKLWSDLLGAKGFYGYSFLRQRPFENYIIDFFCKELNWAIEVDGYSHLFKHEKDKERDKYFTELGIKVIRFTDNEVLNDFDNIIRTLEFYLNKETSSPLPPSSGKLASTQGGKQTE